MNLLLKTEKTIKQNKLLNPGDSVIVALSGGADSVALLLVLNEIGFYHLSAAHVNHSLRGGEADADEAFCRKLCAALDIPIYCRAYDIPALAAQKKQSVELCAREARYAFLEEVAEKDNSMIAAAHHAGDNTETLIMNICRGTGLSGLCGIPIRRGRIIRPFLTATREEILEYLSQKNQPYRTDATNGSLDYTRNAVRHTVAAPLYKLYPTLDRSVSRLTQNLREDVEYIEHEADRVYNEYNTGKIDIKDISELPAALKKRALLRIAADFGKNTLYETQLGELLRLCDNRQGIVSLRGDIAVTAENGRIVLYQAGNHAPREPVAVKLGETALWDGYFAMVQNKPFNINSNKINNSAHFGAFSCDILNGSAFFRTRREGDTVYLPGRHIHKPLKKLFNEMKLSANRRGGIPVIDYKGEVIWVYGVDNKQQNLIAENAPCIYVCVWKNDYNA